MSSLTNYVDQISSENKAKINAEKQVEHLLASKRRLNEALELAIVDVSKLRKSNPAEAIRMNGQIQADHMVETTEIDSQISKLVGDNGIDFSGMFTKIGNTALETATISGSVAGSIVNKPLKMLDRFAKGFLNAAKA